MRGGEFAWIALAQAGGSAAADLANAVTGFAVMGAGVAALLLCRMAGPQPARWLLVYWEVVITGVATVGWHGFDGPWWKAADVSTNLLVAFVLQLAVLGDYYGKRASWAVGSVSGLLNLAAIGWLVYEAATGAARDLLMLGPSAALSLGDLFLAADAVLAVVLLYAKHSSIPVRARPLLYVLTAVFAGGLLLAAPEADVVAAAIVPVHALWHLSAALGFVLLWGFNHLRFNREPFVLVEVVR